jgi:hypothetical protein
MSFKFENENKQEIAEYFQGCAKYYYSKDNTTLIIPKNQSKKDEYTPSKFDLEEAKEKITKLHKHVFKTFNTLTKSDKDNFYFYPEPHDF